jgi:hypothetical protein
MGLTLPVVSVTIGPDWATLLNTDLTTIEAHDHSSGKGNPIPASALNMNGDVSWNPSGGSSGNNITGLRTARFVAQSALLGATGDAGCLSNVLGDLYWNYTTGSRVKITSAGSLNAAGLAANTWSTLEVLADHVIGASDTDVFFHCTTAAPLLVTLPDGASVVGKYYVINNDRTSSDLVTIQTSGGGSDQIDDDETGLNEVTIKPNGTIICMSIAGGSWKLIRDSHQLRGATVPAGYSTTTGNVLQVSASRTLSYGPIHLDLGANYVTGLLPPGNMTEATTVASGTVKLTNDLGGTGAVPTVVALTGAAGVIPVGTAGNIITWGSTVTAPGIKHTAAGAGVGADMTIWAQDAGTASSAGGRLILKGGSNLVAGETTSKGVRIAVGAINAFDFTSTGTASVLLKASPLSGAGAGGSVTFQGQDGSGGGNSGGPANLLGGASGGGAGVQGAALVGSGTGMVQSTSITSSRNVVGLCTGTTLSATNVPAGDGVVFIATCNALPTSTPVGGGILYIHSGTGALRFKGAGGTDSLLAAT